MKYVNAFAAAALVAALLLPAGADVSSTFDSGADGWLVADVDPNSHQSSVTLNNTSIWSATAGTSGGGLAIPDVTYWTHIAAPAAYLGDWSHGYGSKINFDLFITYTDGVPYSACAIRGLGHTLYYVTPTPQVGSWHHFEIPIALPGWKVDSYLGRDATAGDFFEVLRSVEGFYVMTEWDTGPDDTRVDNILLGLDPRRPVGINIRNAELTNNAARSGSGHYRFRVWGVVKAVDPSGIVLEDESGNQVRVDTFGPVQQVGQRIAVSGKVSYAPGPVTITCTQEDITQL